MPQLLCAFDGIFPPQRTSLRQSWGMAKRGRFVWGGLYPDVLDVLLGLILHWYA